MTEDQLFAKIGRLHVESEFRKQSYDHLLKLFSEVISGECDPQRVQINLTDGTYTWSEPGSRPAMPCQINGVPKIVMAPEKERLPIQIAPGITTEFQLEEMPPAVAARMSSNGMPE